MAMHYTPGQLQDVLDLPKQTFRYWKAGIPQLKPVTRTRACFGPADLLATAILKQVTDLGIPVGRLGAVATPIFESCRATGWPHLERLTVMLQLRSGSATFEVDPKIPTDEPAIVVPLAPLIESLRGHLLEGDVEAQHSLKFPPVSVSGKGRK